MRLLLKLKGISQQSGIKVISSDITSYGVQIESPVPVNINEKLEITVMGSGRLKKKYKAMGKIRWTRHQDGKFRSGIIFTKEINWPLPLYSLSETLEKFPKYSSVVQDLIDTIDDGILVIDASFNILASNRHQSLCVPRDPVRLRKKNLSETSSILNVSVEGMTFREHLRRAMKTRTEKRINAFQYIGLTSADQRHPRFYNIWVSPIMDFSGSTCLVLRTRDVTALHHLRNRQSIRERYFKYQYNHLTLGFLFDDLLEDLVNPLSAVMGRLDLIRLKHLSDRSSCEADDYGDWTTDLRTAQDILRKIKDYCYLATKRRDKEILGSPVTISLNHMIKDEIKTLELHTPFRKIRKNISLQPNLPLFRAEYTEWANSFVAVCHAMMKQMTTLDRGELWIRTAVEDGNIVLQISHNGQALRFSPEEPAFTFLQYLRQKHGIKVCISGGSGFQSVTFKLALS